MNKTDRAMIAAQREREELGMGIPPAGYKALEAVTDVVLAYRPKSKQPKPRKRKPSQRKSKGCICDPKCREDQIGTNPYCKAKHAGTNRD